MSCKETQQLSEGGPPNAPSSSTHEPPSKRFCFSLFAHYRPTAEVPTGIEAVTQQLSEYLMTINSATFDEADTSNQFPQLYSRYPLLNKLFQSVLCTPASSAPVERIFSQSGLIMSARRAKMANKTLETLCFLKCNEHL